MSREIKFRAYNKRTNLMTFHGAFRKDVWLSIAFDGKLIALGDSSIGGWQELEQELVNELVLMQYTGLKDKNSKEIYEGDIVRYQSNNYQICFGKWGNDCMYDAAENGFGWYMDDGIKCHTCCAFDGEDIEIIGDIYMNPTLLKEDAR